MRKLLVFLGILITAITTSCVVYHPQSADIPLINKKNDLSIDAGVSIIPSAHATISYGMTDVITVQGFGSIGSDNKYYFQVATGLYRNLVNNKVMEFYTGFGYGYGNAFEDSNPGNLFGDYQLYFAQWNYGKIANQTSNIEIGFGIKSGYLHSNLIDENYYDWQSVTGPFENYTDDSFLLEPAGFIRLGGEKIKINIKLGGSLIYKFTNTNKNFPYSYINFGIGINYQL